MRHLGRIEKCAGCQSGKAATALNFSHALFGVPAVARELPSDTQRLYSRSFAVRD